MDSRLAAWARQVKARQVKASHLKAGQGGAGQVGAGQVGAGQASLVPPEPVPAKVTGARAGQAGASRGGPRPQGTEGQPGSLVRRRGGAVPSLWLFTDAVRMPDPLPAIALLPPGSGVVFRHDGHPGRAALARAVARLCRARRLALVVAGDARLAAAVGAGLHLRGGRRGPGPAGRWLGGWRRPGGGLGGRGAAHARLLTSSAHGVAELVRAGRAGADAAFLSPLLPTASHPGGRALGPVRWAGLLRAVRHRGPAPPGGPGGGVMAGAGRSGLAVLALGGVSGGTFRQVPPGASGAGVTGAGVPRGDRGRTVLG